jgi:hypothetical protein
VQNVAARGKRTPAECGPHISAKVSNRGTEPPDEDQAAERISAIVDAGRKAGPVRLSDIEPCMGYELLASTPWLCV